MSKHLLICLILIFSFNKNWAQSDASKQKPLQKLLYVYYNVNGNDEVKVINLDLAAKGHNESLPNPDKQFSTEEEHFIVHCNSLISSNFKLSIQAKSKIVLQNIKIALPHLYTPHLALSSSSESDTKYFCNGFQSWTTSQELGSKDKIRTLAGILKPYGQHLGDYNHYYKYPRKKGILHSWSFTYKRFKDEYAFIGSRNENTGYTLFVHDTKTSYTYIQKDCKGLVLDSRQIFDAFDLLFKKGTQAEVWDSYTNSLGKNPSKAKPAIGWTSWYNYYAKIDEKIILENLNNFAEADIPLDIFQIDDGYQSQMGDWLTCNEKFPNGMHPISQEIHKKGYKAGLWLAPFVASKKSKVFKDHPDWFIKNKKGKALKVAINVMWKAPYYALDIYNKEVQAHLKKVIQTILFDWEYDMIKVDFLFAACLQGTNDKTRGQIMSDAMKLLREYAGKKLILGCGVPLAPSFNLVDYCRVGNDAHLGWEFGILKAFGNAERPSTWSTLTNTIMRYHLSGKFFLNDPDVFILRKENTQLKDKEKYTMLLINNLLGAVIFNSDNIANYDKNQMTQYKAIFPYVSPENISIKNNEQTYTIEFNVADRNYFMLCNMGKKSRTHQVPQARFFDSKTGQILDFRNSKDTSVVIDAHASKLWYKIEGNVDMEVLGGSNHIIPGQEVKIIESLASNSILVDFTEKAQTTQEILFFVKDKTTSYVYINGEKCKVNNQIARFKRE